jgi:hypothetical protein
VIIVTPYNKRYPELAADFMLRDEDRKPTDRAKISRKKNFPNDASIQ